MKRKNMNLYRSEIRRLLRQIDRSFVPGVVYSPDSLVVCDASALRFVIDSLYKELIGDE